MRDIVILIFVALCFYRWNHFEKELFKGVSRIIEQNDERQKTLDIISKKLEKDK